MIRQKCGREATIKEIAVATELSQEEIVMALEANTIVDSIDRTLTNQEGDGVSVSELLPSEKNEQLRIENRLLIQQLMKELSVEEQQVIKMRYYEDKTQTEIGSLLSISQVQVSRIEKRALKKMRQ